VAADGDSASPSVSGDGSRVVFQSTATNLTADADLGTEDIFLYDFAAGTMTRVTESAGGGEADGPSSNPAISSDGRFVAFQSDATDLIVGDTNGIADVFRRALPAGAVERVSVSESGAEVFNAFAFGSVTPSLSADGSRVAFASDCDDLVTGKTTPWLDIFVRDFGAVAPFLTVRVSIEGAVETDGDSRAPSISADGRWVAFESDATVLAGGEANGFGDIYLADAQTGLVERISVNSAGVGAVNDHCARPSISGDGLLVAFESASFNLVEGDTNGAGDVFLRDRQRGTTTRLSVSTLGAQTGSTETCGRVTLSLDGRFAAFRSNSGVLVSDDTNGLDDIFVRGPLR
jgi:Tol biopolymer transport system component